MKKNMKKKTLLTMSVALLFAGAVGITLAYIFSRTDPVENTFKPSKVSCAVVETDEKGTVTENTNNIVYTGTTKKNVRIKNTGHTDAYIRAAVVVNWMSEDGTRVWATKPVEGIDFTISYNLSNDGWINGGDGYYYYTQSVVWDGLTEVLIDNTRVQKNAPQEGYYLSVEIVASAIQSNGMGATTAQDAWTTAKTGTNAG